MEGLVCRVGRKLAAKTTGEEAIHSLSTLGGLTLRTITITIRGGKEFLCVYIYLFQLNIDIISSPMQGGSLATWSTTVALDLLFKIYESCFRQSQD